jgi:hypothetical protein
MARVPCAGNGRCCAAQSLQDYEQLAVHLATHPHITRKLRAKLEKGRTSDRYERTAHGRERREG